jgi:hypothetical protein
VADLNAKTYLESERDVDDYVSAKLRAQLMAPSLRPSRASSKVRCRRNKKANSSGTEMNKSNLKSYAPRRGSISSRR